MTPQQCKMARIALNITAENLAEQSESLGHKVGYASIARFEKGDTMRQGTIDTIQSALENAGVIFLASGDTTSGGVGVRLKEDQRQVPTSI